MLAISLMASVIILNLGVLRLSIKYYAVFVFGSIVHVTSLIARSSEGIVFTMF